MQPKLPVNPAELALLERYFQGDLPDTPIGHAVSRLRGKQARDMAKWLEYELARDVLDWWRIYKDYQDKEEHERERERERSRIRAVRNRKAMIEGKKAKEEQFAQARERDSERLANATPEDKARAYALWQSAHKVYPIKRK